jgi:hypothetical protein
MYIVTRIPQIDGSIRFVGASSRRVQREWQAAIRSDPAMIDGIRADAIRDCRPGRRPAGWED